MITPRRRRAVLPVLVLGAALAGCSTDEAPLEAGPASTLAPGGVDLPGELVVPAAGACPGYTVGTPTEDAATGGAAGFALPGGGAVVLTCMGDTDEVGSVEDLVGTLLAGAEDGERPGQLSGPSAVSSPYGEAYRMETRFEGNGTSLTEWFTERDDAVFGVGYLRGADDADETATVEAMLADWRWG